MKNAIKGITAETASPAGANFHLVLLFSAVAGKQNCRIVTYKM
jgi:hypothetical protein